MLGKLMNTYHVYTVHMSPTLGRSSALQRFECGSAIEGIMFNSYPGLHHAFPAYYFNSPAVLLTSKWRKKKTVVNYCEQFTRKCFNVVFTLCT